MVGMSLWTMVKRKYKSFRNAIRTTRERCVSAIVSFLLKDTEHNEVICEYITDRYMRYVTDITCDINDRWKSDNSPIVPELETMLSYLLWKDIIFISTRSHSSLEGGGVVLCVLLNDVFLWACSDAEQIAISELPEVYLAYKNDPIYGVVKWGCKRRDMKPQNPLQALMKSGGSWDAEMEALPNNIYETKGQCKCTH